VPFVEVFQHTGITFFLSVLLHFRFVSAGNLFEGLVIAMLLFQQGASLMP
jgi:hypothetical protein